MDKTDRKLLSHMQRDAALSVGELADRIGISKSACWRRIQKLEADGTIRKQVTLLDPAALGVPLTVFISVRTNQHNQQWAENFKRVVEGIPGVLEVYRMGGEIEVSSTPQLGTTLASSPSLSCSSAKALAALIRRASFIRIILLRTILRQYEPSSFGWTTVT